MRAMQDGLDSFMLSTHANVQAKSVSFLFLFDTPHDLLVDSKSSLDCITKPSIKLAFVN